MTGTTAKRLAEVVKECIVNNELHVHEEGVDEDNDTYFDFLFTGARGNQLHSRLIIRAEQIIVVTQLPFKISTSAKPAMLSTIHEINASLAVGAFTTDAGHVAFRSGFNLTPKATVTPDCIFMTLLSNVEIADQFLPTFLRMLK